MSGSSNEAKLVAENIALHVAIERHAASENPGDLASVYRALLDAMLIVPLMKQRQPPEPIAFVIYTRPDGSKFTPVFTSLAGMRSSAPGFPFYIAATGRSVLPTIAKLDVELLVNPVTADGKMVGPIGRLPKEMIRTLAAGLVVTMDSDGLGELDESQAPAATIAPAGPGALSSALEHALRAACKRDKKIRAAKLCLVRRGTIENLTLVIDFEKRADMKHSYRALTDAIRPHLADGTIDVAARASDFGQRLFASGTPFYVKWSLFPGL
jgi:hypothetical protein